MILQYREVVQYETFRGFLKPLISNEESSLSHLPDSLICTECRLRGWDELKMRVKTTQLPGLRREARTVSSSRIFFFNLDSLFSRFKLFSDRKSIINESADCCESTPSESLCLPVHFNSL